MPKLMRVVFVGGVVLGGAACSHDGRAQSGSRARLLDEHEDGVTTALTESQLVAAADESHSHDVDRLTADLVVDGLRILASTTELGEPGRSRVVVSAGSSIIFDWVVAACEDQPYLLLAAVDDRPDVIVARYGCIAGEDDQTIVGEVWVLGARDSGAWQLLWAGVERTRVLWGYCWDESYVDVVAVADDFVDVIRIQQKYDSNPDEGHGLACEVALLTETREAHRHHPR